ncbi:YIP1 family protein [Candidatus Gottesmanbacteria bacterium]|nr:YIP1 family protein [Candidatus Gottesmanbacteria bacterium]
MIDQFLFAGVLFGRNLVGIITKPYETYRRIVDRGNLFELVYIVFLLLCYFAIASIVKTAAFRPFLLTKHFLILFGASSLTYTISVTLLWQIGKTVGGKGSLRRLMVSWGYTLVPTVMWFMMTSILYIILPPPRTTSVAGIVFSVLFLVFSTTLLFWKITLAYLTLRFGLRLDLLKIFIVTAIVGPLLALYSIWMYRMGIFKVPFL